jgi:hypothetical protein
MDPSARKSRNTNALRNARPARGTEVNGDSRFPRRAKLLIAAIASASIEQRPSRACLASPPRCNKGGSPSQTQGEADNKVLDEQTRLDKSEAGSLRSSGPVVLACMPPKKRKSSAPITLPILTGTKTALRNSLLNSS